MSDKKHELLLIFAALIISAVLMLYNVFDLPKYSPLEASLAPVTAVTEKSTAPYAGQININTASLEELMTLDGIGEERAAAIIEYRNKNGLFRSVDELGEVEGIGDVTLERNRDRLCV